jgi:hypothetical protein
MGQPQFSKKQTIELPEVTDKNSNISRFDLLTFTYIAMICLNFHFIAYDDNIVMCVLDYDPCVPNPCTHGTCTTSTGSVQCSCHSGYSGTTCGKCICFEQQFYERWLVRNNYKRARIYMHSPNTICASFEYLLPFLLCLLGFLWEKDWISPLNTVHVYVVPN